MRWEQGAYVFVPNGVMFDRTAWLDDQDPMILSIGANVTRINSLIENQAVNASFNAVMQANAIAAELRSPEGDQLAATVSRAHAAVASGNPNAPALIVQAQQALANVGGNPAIAANAMDAVAALDHAVETLHPGAGVVQTQLTATPPNLTNPLLTTSAPTMPQPKLPPANVTQPILQQVGNAHVGAEWVPLVAVAALLFFLGRGSR